MQVSIHWECGRWSLESPVQGAELRVLETPLHQEAV